MKKLLFLIFLVGCTSPAATRSEQSQEPATAKAVVDHGQEAAVTSDSVPLPAFRRSEQAIRWREEAKQRLTLMQDTASYTVASMDVRAPQTANLLFEPDGEIYLLVLLEEERAVEFEFTVTITETGQILTRQGFTTTVRGGTNSDIFVNIPLGDGAFIGAGESRRLRFTARAISLDRPVSIGFLPLRIEAMLQQVEPERYRAY